MADSDPEDNPWDRLEGRAPSKSSLEERKAPAITTQIYSYGNRDTFEGKLERGRREGAGTYVYGNFDTYEGEWLNGDKHGKGKYIYRDGSVYEGQWVNGNKHGRGEWTCTKTMRSYVGQYEKDCMSGAGVYKYANGDRYEGEFEKDNRSGWGIYRYHNGDQYEGEWKDGCRSEGVLRYKNGDVYEGPFASDRQTGVGTYMFAEGLVYHGNFLRGRMHGKGTLTDSKQNKKIHGVWRRGELMEHSHQRDAEGDET